MVAMTLLAAIATAYGLCGAASSLLEAATLLRSGRADEISLAFLGVLLGGYLVWLLYGISAGDEPLIVTDAVGLAAGTITLSVAVRLRLRHGARASGYRK
jgi:MtN3 and saliva related transmembrane protein